MASATREVEIMKSNYRGDHPCKRVARRALWLDVLTWCQGLPSPMLVLASSDGGDIGTYSAFGALGHIIAVDTDLEAVKKCRLRWPGADIRHCSAEDVGEQLGGAYLDFCGTLNDRTLRTIKKVAHQIVPGGVLAVTFLKGRDSKATVCLGNRKSRRRQRRRSGQNKVPLKGTDTRNRIGVMVSALKSSVLAFEPVRTFEYKSTSPMITFWGQIGLCNRSVDLESIIKINNISERKLRKIIGEQPDPYRELLLYGYCPAEARAIAAHISRGTYDDKKQRR